MRTRHAHAGHAIHIFAPSSGFLVIPPWDFLPKTLSLGVCGALLIVALGSGTYIRNMAWATEKTFWEDALRKAPISPCPLVNLAAKYYEPIGRVDLGVALNNEALKLSDGHPKQFKAICLKNVGNFHLARGEYQKAPVYYD